MPFRKKEDGLMARDEESRKVGCAGGCGPRFALVLLGPDNEYLGIYGVYSCVADLERDSDELEPLILANITGDAPLRERLALAPRYFPFAGRVHGLGAEDLLALLGNGDMGGSRG